MVPERIYLVEQFKIRFKSDAQWFKLYGDMKGGNRIVANATYGKDVEVNAWVDEDHVGD